MKNTLAENMLRFGSKNLDSKSVKKLQKLAEQQTTDPKSVDFSEAFPALSVGKTIKYPAFVTPKILYKDARGESNVGWTDAVVMKLNDTFALIFGNRSNAKDGKYYPTMSLTQANNGYELLATAKGTADLISLINTMFKYTALSEVDYTNMFKALKPYLTQYVKMNTKAELDALTEKNPTLKAKVDNIAAALGIVEQTPNM
jgi:hypothetical protein